MMSQKSHRQSKEQERLIARLDEDQHYQSHAQINIITPGTIGSQNSQNNEDFEVINAKKIHFQERESTIED